MNEDDMKMFEMEKSLGYTMSPNPVKITHITEEDVKKIEEDMTQSPIMLSTNAELSSGFIFPIRFQLNRPHYPDDEKFLNQTYKWFRVPQKGEVVYFRSANSAYDVIAVCAIVDKAGNVESYSVTLS